MKRKPSVEQGSVLAITLLTISVITMLCATSLYIASQNSSTTSQTAAWQQALDAAESAMNWGIVAINKQATGDNTAWTSPQWYSVSPNPYSLPAIQPSGGTQANNGSGGPSAGTYYYFIPSNVTLTSTNAEGSPAISGWVIVDTGAGNLQCTLLPGASQCSQWYRMRATGIAYISGGMRRVSNEKLDLNLRNTISLLVDRKSNAAIPAPTASPSPGSYAYDRWPMVTRTIEVVMQPQSSSNTAYTSLTKNQFNMSGGATMHGDVAILDTRKLGNSGTTSDSDLKSTYLYGNLTYSGPPVKNTSNVQGNISTPFTAPTPTPASDPSWTQGSLPTQYTSLTVSGNQTITAGAANSTQVTSKKLKVTGDMTLPGGNSVVLAPYIDSQTGQPVESYFEIWITGQLTASGGGFIQQQAHTWLTIYVDDKITVSGSSYIKNDNNSADHLTINGNWVPSNQNSYTPLAATFSGGSNFYGKVNAPYYAFTVSGSSQYHGSFIGDNMTVSGSASLWADSSLNGNNSGNGNYAYASWFEDNSDPKRGVVY